jgi:hypothetical protein
MKPIGLPPDLILRSPATRSDAGRLEGWRLGTAVARGHPTHRLRDALRVRFGEDADTMLTEETLT